MNKGFDWLASKIYQTKDLVSYDFGYCFVFYQNLLTSHIWLVKSMTVYLSNFGMTNLVRKPVRPVSEGVSLEFNLHLIG